MQIVRYFFVGGVAAVVDVAVFAALINLLGVHYLVAGAAGFLLAMNVYAAKVGAIALVFFWNFFPRKHFVFAPAVPRR